MSTITWDQANFLWNNNQHTWDEVKLLLEVLKYGGLFT